MGWTSCFRPWPTLTDSDMRWTAFVLLIALSGCGSVAPDAPRRIDASLLQDLETVTGERLDAARALRDGQTLALVFWQPWCSACVDEVPGLLAAQRRFADDLRVVSIVSGPAGSVDEDLVHATIDEHRISYPVVRDTTLALTEHLGVDSTPTIVVVDRDGNLVYVGPHVSDWAHLVHRR